MRIHRLRAQAFGPFTDEVEVDLDALSDAGLFLLTGATGAGKTSVLDAVCFALYGAVPGDRQSAKRLRSDQAAPGVAPEVDLELTVDGRRFRIHRSPAWERAKKRGPGTTTQQASVLVEERVADEWRALATRLDDAGHLVTGLLGMNLTQFCQVQLLPQGRFQAFLRAGSVERHQLLQQLFRTSRFEDVEAWLRERRRHLRRESARHHERVADLVSRTSEAAGDPLPESWDLHALEPVADLVGGWVDGLAEEAAHRSAAAADRRSVATEREQGSADRLRVGRELAERQQRHARASEEQESLAAEGEAHTRREQLLDAGRRSLAVVPLVEAARRAEQVAAAAEARAERATAEAAAALDEPELAGLLDAREWSERSRGAAETAAEVRARQPLVAELTELLATLADDGAVLAELDQSLVEVAAEQESLPATLAQRRTTEAEAVRAHEALPAAEVEVETVRARRDAARLVGELVRQRAEVTALHQASVDHAQERREAWLDLQERRLTGMAAEIAGALAVGADCPVCGSLDHPHPAAPLPGAPDATAVRDARRAVDDAESERHARAMAVSDLESTIAATRERAGHASVPDLERELTDREGRLARLRQRADTLPAATAAREGLEQHTDQLTGRAVTLAAERAGVAARLEARRDRAATVEREVADILDGTGHDSIASLASAWQLVADRASLAHDALAERERCRAEAGRCGVRALEAAREQGFDDPDAAQRAATAAGDLTALDSAVTAHRSRTAAVSAVLADPELLAAAALPEPDLPDLAARHALDAEQHHGARDVAAAQERRAARLAGLRHDLVTALSAWEPVRADHALADRLASFVEGTSPDNRLRMRLSGYVLSFRLGQVVAAANERLVAMTDGRYQLEHSADRGAGETRGGLSLRVRDDWSGESRDPVTLSGGETFVVSLALALGLADVIAHEAGGSELDTLFVDEGFGTLDADSLDHVMDMLDSLRDGGRVVGVVSHVAELRDRIPAQLHVRKHRSGSTLHQGCPG